MELRHLRYFVVVAEEENVGRAAERLHVSQSPLSRQIRQLEERLGVTLFQREKKRLRLTEIGRAFLGEARALLRESDDAVSRTQRLAAGETGTLAIGFVDGAVHGGVLQAALRRLQTTRPGIRIELAELRSAPQKEALLRGALDVGLLYTPPPPDDPRLASELVLDQRLVLALPRQHPLATVATIRPADLDGAPWIALPRAIDAAARERFLAACAGSGFHPDIRFEAASITTVLGLVGANLGVAMAQEGVRQMALETVVLRDLPWFPLRVRVYAAWSRLSPRPTVAHFLEILTQGLEPPARTGGPPGLESP